MADRFALGAYGRTFRPKMAIGVDLQFDAAIRVDALGDDGHHVYAVDLRRDDERRRFVVGIGRAGADRGDDGRGGVDDIAAPFAGPVHEGHDLATVLQGAFEQHMWIDAHQFAVTVGVTVTGAAHAGADVAKHRAGVAADLVVNFGHSRSYPAAPRIAPRNRSGVASLASFVYKCSRRGALMSSASG